MAGKVSGEAVQLTSPPSGSLTHKLSDALAPEYQLTRELGTGGMGTVFLAREPTLRRDVAVKVLSPDLARDATAQARFQREAQAVASLSHPNVVGVYRVGALADGTQYFVMQYVAGESLGARLAREGPMGVGDVRRALAQVAAALAAAHAKGIIHRDIKPANILYDPESNRVLVSDFGIAALKSTDESRGPLHLTGTGMSIGTPQYMSPEQLLAEPVTDKTDIYSLGLLGYELLAGHGPFQATTPHELIASVLRDTPKPLSVVRSDMDPELEGLIAACLNRDAGARPSAAEVVQRLGVDQPPLIEWPPPGLDGLLRDGPRLARRVAIGSLPFALGIMLMLILDDWVPAGNLVVVPLAAAVVVLAGSVALGWALWHAGRIAAMCARALRYGYGWGTVVEVSADRRGDTGAVVSGSREYASLIAGERERLRRRRLVAAALLLGAAALPVAAALAFIFGLSRLAGPGAYIALVLAGSLLLFAVGSILVALEDRGLHDARRRLVRQRPQVDWAALVASWREAFEQAHKGRRLGMGAGGSPRAARAVGLAVAAAVGIAILLALPPVLVGAAGAMVWNAMVTGDVSQGRLGRLQDLAEIMRPLRPAPDTTITAADAGRLFARLIASPRAQLPRSSASDHAVPAWQGDLVESPLGVWTFQPDSMMRRASRGFSPAQRAYLHSVADTARIGIIRRLGHAREMDVVGALFALPFPDSTDAGALEGGVWGFAPRRAASAALAGAGLLVSEGRRAAAESLLLETASFGLLLADEATGRYDAVVGHMIAGTARQALMSLSALGVVSPGLARLRDLSDSVVAVSASRASNNDFERYLGPFAGRVNDLEYRVLSIIYGANSAAPRSVQWEYLRLAATTRCSNTRELLFGLSPTTQAYFSGARRDMIRRPSDEAVYELLLRPPRWNAPAEPDLASLMVRLSSRLTGNPWVDYCYRLGIRLATRGESER